MSAPSPGRSRSASLPISGKGLAGRHRLLRVPACIVMVTATQRAPQAPWMLDETPALFSSNGRATSWHRNPDIFFPRFPCQGFAEATLAYECAPSDTHSQTISLVALKGQ